MGGKSSENEYISDLINTVFFISKCSSCNGSVPLSAGIAQCSSINHPTDALGDYPVILSMSLTLSMDTSMYQEHSCEMLAASTTSTINIALCHYHSNPVFDQFQYTNRRSDQILERGSQVLLLHCTSIEYC